MQFNTNLPCTHRSAKTRFSFRFADWNICSSHISHPRYMLHPSHPPSFDHLLIFANEYTSRRSSLCYLHLSVTAPLQTKYDILLALCLNMVVIINNVFIFRDRHVKTFNGQNVSVFHIWPKHFCTEELVFTATDPCTSTQCVYWRLKQLQNVHILRLGKQNRSFR
jgi:hypothetical protein